MFENENITNTPIFKATDLSHDQVIEIVGQEKQGLFVLFCTTEESITLQSVQNIGFAFPHWERTSEQKTISVNAFLRKVASLEPEEE
ncbi:MAG: hypothetical protein EOM19_01155 [Candidatus Moranbacteria bacterium]|nr:hypothetical protein [Candidatus Moranbacteria bacterium]